MGLKGSTDSPDGRAYVARSTNNSTCQSLPSCFPSSYRKLPTNTNTSDVGQSIRSLPLKHYRCIDTSPVSLAILETACESLELQSLQDDSLPMSQSSREVTSGLQQSCKTTLKTEMKYDKEMLSFVTDQGYQYMQKALVPELNNMKEREREPENKLEKNLTACNEDLDSLSKVSKTECNSLEKYTARLHSKKESHNKRKKKKSSSPDKLKVFKRMNKMQTDVADAWIKASKPEKTEDDVTNSEEINKNSERHSQLKKQKKKICQSVAMLDKVGKLSDLSEKQDSEDKEKQLNQNDLSGKLDKYDKDTKEIEADFKAGNDMSFKKTCFPAAAEFCNFENDKDPKVQLLRIEAMKHKVAYQEKEKEKKQLEEIHAALAVAWTTHTKEKKNMLNIQLTCEPTGEGEFYSFEDNRFLEERLQKQDSEQTSLKLSIDPLNEGHKTSGDFYHIEDPVIRPLCIDDNKARSCHEKMPLIGELDHQLPLVPEENTFVFASGTQFFSYQSLGCDVFRCTESVAGQGHNHQSYSRVMKETQEDICLKSGSYDGEYEENAKDSLNVKEIEVFTSEIMQEGRPVEENSLHDDNDENLLANSDLEQNIIAATPSVEGTEPSTDDSHTVAGAEKDTDGQFKDVAKLTFDVCNEKQSGVVPGELEDKILNEEKEKEMTNKTVVESSADEEDEGNDSDVLTESQLHVEEKPGDVQASEKSIRLRKGKRHVQDEAESGEKAGYSLGVDKSKEIHAALVEDTGNESDFNELCLRAKNKGRFIQKKNRPKNQPKLPNADVTVIIHTQQRSKETKNRQSITNRNGRFQMRFQRNKKGNPLPVRIPVQKGPFEICQKVNRGSPLDKFRNTGGGRKCSNPGSGGGRGTNGSDRNSRNDQRSGNSKDDNNGDKSADRGNNNRKRDDDNPRDDFPTQAPDAAAEAAVPEFDPKGPRKKHSDMNDTDCFLFLGKLTALNQDQETPLFKMSIESVEYCVLRSLFNPEFESADMLACSFCNIINSLLKHYADCQALYNDCKMCVQIFSLICAHVNNCLMAEACGGRLCTVILHSLAGEGVAAHMGTLWFRIRKKLARLIGGGDVVVEPLRDPAPRSSLRLSRKSISIQPMLQSIPETGPASHTSSSSGSRVLMRKSSKNLPNVSEDVRKSGTVDHPSLMWMDPEPNPRFTTDIHSLPMGPPAWHEPSYPSFKDQPTGTKGIGEVVISNKKQMKKVAQMWDTPKHRFLTEGRLGHHYSEEGIILEEYKDKLVVAGIRYGLDFQWEKLSHLGNGMSGKCSLAKDFTTDFLFCVKEIHISKYECQEIEVWTELDHPHIVRMYGAIRHAEKIYIFMEFVDGGCLTEVINQQKLLNQRVSQHMALLYFNQILQVLVYLKNKQVLHEDIKADNLLLHKKNKKIAIKMTDFGLARRCQKLMPKNTKPIGTQTQWSPQKAQGLSYGFCAEVWAATCVLIHMLTGYPPWIKRFGQQANKTLIFLIVEKSPPKEDIPRNINDAVIELIESALTRDRDVRPTAEQLLQHRAFTLLDEDSVTNTYSILESGTHLSTQLEDKENKDLLNIIEGLAAKSHSHVKVPGKPNISQIDGQNPHMTLLATGDDDNVKTQVSMGRSAMWGQEQNFPSDILAYPVFPENNLDPTSHLQNFIHDQQTPLQNVGNLPTLTLYQPEDEQKNSDHMNEGGDGYLSMSNILPKFELISALSGDIFAPDVVSSDEEDQEENIFDNFKLEDAIKELQESGAIPETVTPTRVVPSNDTAANLLNNLPTVVDMVPSRSTSVNKSDTQTSSLEATVYDGSRPRTHKHSPSPEKRTANSPHDEDYLFMSGSGEDLLPTTIHSEILVTTPDNTGGVLTPTSTTVENVAANLSTYPVGTSSPWQQNITSPASSYMPTRMSPTVQNPNLVPSTAPYQHYPGYQQYQPVPRFQNIPQQSSSSSPDIRSPGSYTLTQGTNLRNDRHFPEGLQMGTSNVATLGSGLAGPSGVSYSPQPTGNSSREALSTPRPTHLTRASSEQALRTSYQTSTSAAVARDVHSMSPYLQNSPFGLSSNYFSPSANKTSEASQLRQKARHIQKADMNANNERMRERINPLPGVTSNTHLHIDVTKAHHAPPQSDPALQTAPILSPPRTVNYNRGTSLIAPNRQSTSSQSSPPLSTGSTSKSQFEAQEDALKLLGKTAEDALSEHSDHIVQFTMGLQDPDEEVVGNELDDFNLENPAESLAHYLDSDIEEQHIIVMFVNMNDDSKFKMRFSPSYKEKTWYEILEQEDNIMSMIHQTFKLTKFFLLLDGAIIDLDTKLGTMSLTVHIDAAPSTASWWVENGMVMRL